MSSVKYLQHDVQAEQDSFVKIPIKKVGVRHIVAPILIKKKSTNKYFDSIADISAYCDLDSDKKGINMSRFGRTLFSECNTNPIKLDNIYKITEKLMKAHDCRDLYLKINFKYIIDDKSPVTNLDSFEPVDCVVESVVVNNIHRIYLTISTNESSCCPCSKNMSLLKNNITDQQLYLINQLPPELSEKILMAGYGAHNQRSNITIKVEMTKNAPLMWIEDLVRVAQSASSAKTCNVLKREDEKHTTERQYIGGYFNESLEFVKVDGSGPKFCEDISRDAADILNNQYLDKLINDYVIIVENEESIHTSLTACSVVSAGRLLK